jgi:hypothetical protein
MKCKCINCQNFYFDSGCPNYSDVTPGDGWSIGCILSLWNLSGMDATQEQFVNNINGNRECSYFEKVNKKNTVQKDFPSLNEKRLLQYIESVYILKNNYDDINICMKIQCKHLHDKQCNKFKCEEIVKNYLYLLPQQKD